MIIIIKRETKHRITCDSCGVVLIYEDEDICVNGNSAYIICPQCNQKIYLEEKNK
jgi:RNase P subunit RPR2